VLISVTDEPASLVIPWMQKNEVTHPVVILKDGKLEDAIGVSSFPTSAVYLNFEQQWKGHPAGMGGALGKAQKAGRKGSLYPKKLAKVTKLIDKHEPLKAYQALLKLQPKLTGEDADWAERFQTHLLSMCERDFKAAKTAVETGFWLKAVSLAQPYLGKDTPFPGAPETGKLIFEILERPSYAKEAKGGEMFVEAKQLEGEYAYEDAVTAYKSILKKCPDTEIAKHAKSRAESLIEAGRPGYKSSCQQCVRNRLKACDKHYKQMKV